MSPTPSPPPTSAPNFTNPYSIAKGLNAVGILCTTLTTFTTAIRLYTKLYIIKTHGWEDYTIFIAWGGFIAYISLCHTDIIRYGAGTHQWDVPVTKIPAFAQLTHIIEILYHPLIAITKLSICLQFIRIFVVGHGTKFWCIQVFIFVNMSYYLARFFISIFQCKPSAKIWNPTLPGHCLNYQAYIFATGIFNVVSDILMLLFPLLCTWNLHMSFKRKLEVSAVFLVGGIALAASILRFIYSTINRGSHDATFDLTRVGVSTAGELAAGILVGNLVVFPRFLSTCSSKFTHHFSTYLSGKSSDLQHHDANPSKISWPGTSNAQLPAPPWLDEHSASKVPREYVKLQDRRCEAVAFPSNSRDEICPIIIKNTMFTNNHEVDLGGPQI